MPTLKASWNEDRAAVTLEVSDRAGVQGIIRTDTNGTRPVRLVAGYSLPGIDSGTFIDHEVALGGWVSYRLQHKDFSSLVWINTATSTGEPWSPRFLLPFTPAVSATALSVIAYDASHASRVTFHDVIGRPDPLVVEGSLSMRSGKLGVYFESLDRASALVELLRRGGTVLYRQSDHAGMDMYFHSEAVDLAVDPERGTHWIVTVTYREIQFPPGEVVSTSGWTFDAARLAFTDFTEMALRHDSYQDLAMGETHV